MSPAPTSTQIPAASDTKVRVATPPPAITLSDAALAHLTRLRDESGGDTLLLRMGVRSGGCSGMSYVMEFEEEANVAPDDAILNYPGGFKLVCDPKSLLYLFGMELGCALGAGVWGSERTAPPAAWGLAAARCRPCCCCSQRPRRPPPQVLGRSDWGRVPVPKPQCGELLRVREELWSIM